MLDSIVYYGGMAIFITDIILNFMRARRSSNPYKTFPLKTVILNYLKLQFWFDLLATIPFEHFNHKLVITHFIRIWVVFRALSTEEILIRDVIQS